MKLVDKGGDVKQRKLVRYLLRGKDQLNKVLIRFSAPRDVEGTGMLTFEGPDGRDEQWLYLPSAKKTRRIAASGKKNKFMGTEFAQHHEWNVDASLDWHIAEHPQRQALQDFLAELGRLYRATPALWRSDPLGESFEWIDCTDKDNTVLSYLRRDGNDIVIVVLNFTPVPRPDYRIGVPNSGRYVEKLSSDDLRFGGSEFESMTLVEADPVPAHNRPYSLKLQIPPLGALVLTPLR